uniref:Uncharacterized protein n=1 Tax=Meloidogyne enterolobii TaxID=390850 RepID=A0A6V7TJ78_MELEN|nr:unnamed protein product [Meloidogyne enterolobii]
MTNGIFIPGDLSLISSFCLSITIYMAIIMKFCYDYKTRDNTTTQVDNANVIKDRLLIFAICLISTIPCPLLFSSYKLFTSIDFNLTDDQSILFSIIWAIFNSNYPLVQCIEEICLFIMSKDFRKLVKNHFVRNTQTHAVATTVYVSQQQGMRQFHVHRNNLVNNN